MGGACSAHGRMVNMLRVLLRKPDWKRCFEDQDVDGNSIKMDHKEIEREGVNWIHLVFDRDM
jgi:hypothetical protein